MLNRKRRVHSATLTIGIALAMSCSCSGTAGSASAPQPPASSEIERAASKARASGQTSITLDVTIPDEAPPPLEERLRSYSAAIVVPVQLAATQTATANEIYTWHIFRIAEWLTQRPASAAYCGIKPPAELRPEPSSILVPVLGGTVTVEGVAVTLTSNVRPPPLALEKTYVIMGIDCAEFFNLPYGADNLFEVGPDGRLILIAAAPLAREPWARTVDELRRKLKDQ